jgi:amino acid transporter
MLPIIFIVIFSIFVFRTARDNGYNAVAWTAATVVGFLGIQFVVGAAAGILLVLAGGWSLKEIASYELVISLIGIIPSIIFVVLIWRHVNVIRDDGTAVQEPPAPPTF